VAFARSFLRGGVSSCALFDSVSDISVRLLPPHEVIVVNSARVSTLRSVDFEIRRANEKIRSFHFDIDIPAGTQETITLEDFTLQEDDKAVVTDAGLSWSM
jgi:hypothetical protein